MSFSSPHSFVFARTLWHWKHYMQPLHLASFLRSRGLSSYEAASAWRVLFLLGVRSHPSIFRCPGGSPTCTGKVAASLLCQL